MTTKKNETKRIQEVNAKNINEWIIDPEILRNCKAICANTLLARDLGDFITVEELVNITYIEMLKVKREIPLVSFYGYFKRCACNGLRTECNRRARFSANLHYDERISTQKLNRSHLGSVDEMLTSLDMTDFRATLTETEETVWTLLYSGHTKREIDSAINQRSDRILSNVRRKAEDYFQVVLNGEIGAKAPEYTEDETEENPATEWFTEWNDMANWAAMNA